SPQLVRRGHVPRSSNPPYSNRASAQAIVSPAYASCQRARRAFDDSFLAGACVAATLTRVRFPSLRISSSSLPPAPAAATMFLSRPVELVGVPLADSTTSPRFKPALAA